ISRPSASVLSISTVCPEALVAMSPGLTALPPGMFSTAAIRPTTCRRSFSCDARVSAASTAAAPDMSNFISSMPGGSLREMPPESNVTPLPTSTTGGCRAPVPRYSSTMKRGGCGPAHGACEHPLELRQRRLLPGFEILDPIERGAGELRDRAAEIVVVELPRVREVDRHRATADPRARQRRRRRGPRLAPAPARKALLGPEPGEQHARGLDAGQIADEQRVAGASGEVPAREQPFQRAA